MILLLRIAVACVTADFAVDVVDAFIAVVAVYSVNAGAFAVVANGVAIDVAIIAV